MIERLPDTFVEVLTPAMEAQIRASIVTTGRPKRRLRWAIPALLVELDRLRSAEATGRAAVRALNELYVAHVNGYGRGYRQHAEQDACQSAFAVLVTDTAKAWLEEGQDA